MAEGSPPCRRHRRIVCIHQQRRTEIGIRGMAGEMDFHHGLGGKGVDIVFRRTADVARTDIDVVDVEQQAAAAAAREFAQEVDFAPGMAFKLQVMRGVFHGDAPLQCVLSA